MYYFIIIFFFASSLGKSHLNISSLCIRKLTMKRNSGAPRAPYCWCVQGKLRGIEIARYSCGRWISLLPFQSLNHNGRKNYKHHNRKKAVITLRFVVERHFKFALCDVRLLFRHLGKLKLVSKNGRLL